MYKMKSAAIILIFLALAVYLGGCTIGSYQARNVDATNSPLVNPDILVKGRGNEALYRYVNQKADFKKYTAILIDPVLVMKDGDLDADEMSNYQTLANNAYFYLTQELEKNYTIIKKPESGAMRVQMAIIDADSSKPVRNTLTTIVPVGAVLSVVKYLATSKQSGVGEITVELKMTDAASGELIGAALDRRVGGKELTKLWSSWHNADDALQYWAKRLSYILCSMRGETNCVNPYKYLEPEK
jgi:PBP1b-binding outer membrane lipoprotein LpoB